MSDSTGKTVGLILLIILLVVVLFRAIPFFFMPFHFLPSLIHNITNLGISPSHIPTMGRGEFFIFSGVTLIPILLLILWIAVTIWVYRDAERRGMSGVLWALLVFVGNLVGLLIYLIVRNDSVPVRVGAENTKPCPSCAKPVQPKFAFCPHCGARLQAVCPACKESVASNWKVCPHCSEKLVMEE